MGSDLLKMFDMVGASATINAQGDFVSEGMSGDGGVSSLSTFSSRKSPEEIAEERKIVAMLEGMSVDGRKVVDVPTPTNMNTIKLKTSLSEAVSIMNSGVKTNDVALDEAIAKLSPIITKIVARLK